MALIKCPSCKVRVSDKQPACPGCGYDLSGSGEGLSLAAAQRRATRKRKANLHMQSYAALFFFVAGIVWIWFGFGGDIAQASYASLFLTCGAALWYVVIRVFVFMSRMKRE